MTRRNDHIVIEQLKHIDITAVVCKRCGNWLRFQLPLIAQAVSHTIGVFTKMHAKCKKVKP